MLKRCFRVQALLFCLHAAVAIGGQNPSSTPQAPAEHRRTSEPYTGDLSIFDSPGRDERLQINRVMDILAIGPGKTVADIGAGSGWFTVRAAKRVGDAGMVYAVDINPEAVRYIDDRVHKEKLHNVKTILSTAQDLPRGREPGYCFAEVARLASSGGQSWNY